ncbi:hypothetical protein [Flagellimonas myxillae]|uniref:hypothetical protein n=1 Tax=Flagellimonas myxillae TaxID=2942214 RepID=UPI00201E942B|nr:hypothetical protein [Muricauda myxillae]MCL6265336.1 hypothetical protein [Muricauda myxillae]
MRFLIKFIPLLVLVLGLQACTEVVQLPEFILEHPLEISVLDSDGKTEHSIYQENHPSESGEPLVEVSKRVTQSSDGGYVFEYTVIPVQQMAVNLQKRWSLKQGSFKSAEFLLPGFWYKRNLRSPEKAPSFKTADYWSFRDDRMSTPMAVAFDPKAEKWLKLERMDTLALEETPDSTAGKIGIRTDIGSLGIGKMGADQIQLAANFPFNETPKSYQSKLTLNPEWKGYYELDAGDTLSVRWKISHGVAQDFTALVSKTWELAYERYQPQPVSAKKTDAEIKEILSNYFYESYAETKDLKGFAGLWFNTQTCENTGVLSVGFCGKTFANAYNLLEYGHEQDNEEHKALARKVLDAYYAKGFTDSGLIRELVYGDNAEDVYSLRKQSEGLKNLLFLMDFDKQQGKEYRKLETTIADLMHKLTEMQDEEGGFPRKFDEGYKVLDDSRGSTQSIITPMIMAARYFKEPKFLEAAIKAGNYAEKYIIDQADYFSSTLDANCEDKEAAAIAAVSFYHLALATEGEKRDKYVDLAKKAAYFGLSWYYLWDVPFAQGSLLKEAGLKTRGWGNVSTENNHIDVWAFDFPHVLEWLSKETQDARFGQMAEVITSSIKDQMLPYEGHMVGVGKKGYMPEIIQHTVWDYGANGKGYLNAHMSVGWTVASIWEVLTPGRFQNFMERNPG